MVRDQIRAIERERLRRLAAVPAAATGPHAMVRLIARVLGVAIETADMLVNEVLSRNLRDRRAVARYAGLTGAPDESGKRRREKGLASPRRQRPCPPRHDPTGLAFSDLSKGQRLAKWFRERTADGRSTTRKTMIVALARKLLIALWRLATTGEATEGIKLRPAGA
jgi:transposase